MLAWSLFYMFLYEVASEPHNVAFQLDFGV